MHATPLQTIKWTWKDNLRKGMEYTQRPWPGLGFGARYCYAGHILLYYCVTIGCLSFMMITIVDVLTLHKLKPTTTRALG